MSERPPTAPSFPDGGAETSAAGPDAPPAPTPASPPASSPTASGRVGAELRALAGVLAADRLTWFAALTAALALTLSRFHGTLAEYHRVVQARVGEGGPLAAALAALFGPGTLSRAAAHLTGPVASFLYWFTASFVLYFALPLVAARLIPGIGWGRLGLGAGDWRFGLVASALLYLAMLPFLVVASGWDAFAGTYPLADGATASRGTLLVYEAGYWAYFVGWEFIYRGLLCIALYPRLGGAAILLSAVPFAVMHAGKPEPEALGSIVAALALGALAVRARSFWYGVLLHGAVATTMDVLALVQSGRFPRAW